MSQTTIRLLQHEDYPYIEAMDTGIEDDYVPRVFDHLVTGNNRLYGLFTNDQLVSMAGYTIYAGRYAMLGRLRSDRRYRGNNYATTNVSHVLNEAFQLNGIQWVGANTQEENTPARRVLEKIGLKVYSTLHGATTDDTSMLETGAKTWQPIHSIKQKRDWLQAVYVQSATVFPYECYYAFPASDELFSDDDLQKWSFFENEAKTRIVITKYDQKKHHYLHTVYPWHDMTEQNGLWETIANEYRKLQTQTEEETYIWMDMTKEKAASLPSNHQFKLPSPWMLHGMERAEWEQSKAQIQKPKTIVGR
ncbi:GNAT family N-acetyltransferase [Oceanobacillus halotolerans]|uniref:GNAT family N-acetyltransferase n=1 Tax=Oceanobacillus halotolerans TaxID=2663380 RepID=UPI0013DA2F79|nr:GNAT family N-acetyltransferase [Oceanobacillus halotolerans]